MNLNPMLLALAQQRVDMEKAAVVPAAAAQAPMPDPAAAGGGGAPMDPAMMAAGGAAPPPGAPPPVVPGMPGAVPAPPPVDPAAAKPKKVDPSVTDAKIYRIQVCIMALMKQLGVPIPPEAAMDPAPDAQAMAASASPPPGLPAPADGGAAAPPGGDPAAGGGAPPPEQAGIPPIDPSQLKVAADESLDILSVLRNMAPVAATKEAQLSVGAPVARPPASVLPMVTDIADPAGLAEWLRKAANAT